MQAGDAKRLRELEDRDDRVAPRVCALASGPGRLPASLANGKLLLPDSIVAPRHGARTDSPPVAASLLRSSFDRGRPARGSPYDASVLGAFRAPSKRVLLRSLRFAASCRGSRPRPGSAGPHGRDARDRDDRPTAIEASSHRGFGNTRPRKTSRGVRGACGGLPITPSPHCPQSPWSSDSSAASSVLISPDSRTCSSKLARSAPAASRSARTSLQPRDRADALAMRPKLDLFACSTCEAILPALSSRIKPT
jgi:hypothetical protein